MATPLQVRVQLRRDGGRVGPREGPWVRAAQVARAWGPADPSALAIVEDHRGRALGWGLYSPQSEIRVRVLEWAPEAGDRRQPVELTPQVDWLERRLTRALAARDALGLTRAGTTGYRELNSEGDGVPGLVIDRYGQDRVVQITTASIAARAPQIVAWVRARTRGRVFVTSPARAAEREGYPSFSESWAGLATGDADEPREGAGTERRADREVDRERDLGSDVGSDPDHVAPLRFTEHGLRFAVPPPPGQKTGGFHDQRENRAAIAALAGARGLPLLDVGCHVGGFAIHAARQGALAIGVDQSALALACARENAARNQLEQRARFVEGDMFAPASWLPALTCDGAPGAEGFGVIVLDPPAMARSKRDVERARGALARTIAALAPHVAASGFLVVCTCSHHLTRAQLDAALLAARGAGRWTRTHALGPGPDHPVAPGHREGEYLRVNVYQRR
ncbi:MAG: class I SAM-dependent rRNA methyltransferase [Myxococcales bacterium]|nr:class I SAM-dependent rRNA methyltransferase [Myxococcales bacterium]